MAVTANGRMQGPFRNRDADEKSFGAGTRTGREPKYSEHPRG